MNETPSVVGNQIELRRATTFEGAKGTHRFHGPIPAETRALLTSHDVFTPEFQRRAERLETEREVADVVAGVAVKVRDEMEAMGRLSEGASEDEIKERKDHLDNIAAKEMSTRLHLMNNGLHMVAGEGSEDALMGANIVNVEGHHGRNSHERKAINDPLECTVLAARGSEAIPGVKVMIAFGDEQGFMDLPKGFKYWEGIAGPHAEELSVNNDPALNIARTIRALRSQGLKNPNELRTVMLNRPERVREHMLAAEELGTDRRLIEAGNFWPALMASSERGEDGKWQMVLGSGGGPEMLMAAAGAKATGRTFMEMKRWAPTREEMSRYPTIGLTDMVKARADSIGVVTAHITDDPFNPNIKGVTPGIRIVEVSTVDIDGLRHEFVVPTRI